MYFRYGSLFDSLLTGDVMVHDKFTGIHSMDLCPLAGLASISLSFSLQLETAIKSSAAEGRKGNKQTNKKKVGKEETEKRCKR